MNITEGSCFREVYLNLCFFFGNMEGKPSQNPYSECKFGVEMCPIHVKERVLRLIVLHEVIKLLLLFCFFAYFINILASEC